MAEEIQLGSQNGIMLNLRLAESKPDNQGLVWADGVITVAGETLIAREEGSAINWTWVDLLEWLSKHWATLLLEQTFPLQMPSVSILDLQGDCERRWANLSDATVEQEEEFVYRFLSRHDLATAFKGLYLDSVYLMRQGLLMEVTSAESGDTQHLPLEQMVNDLEQIGQELAKKAAKGAPGTRGALAAEQWKSRANSLAENAISIVTSLSADSLAELNPTKEPAFWEFEPETPLIESELMAAARMTSGTLQLEHQNQVLEWIRRLPKASTQKLDDLSTRVEVEFTPEGKHHDQGYQAAIWLRKTLNISEQRSVSPQALLRDWGVKVESDTLPDSRLGALACWGPQHGPAILINKAENSVSSHRHGENSTLAHEICHLLLDRQSALPVAEVLNGNTPERLEKRARAFAAELLLPRQAVEDHVRKFSELRLAVKTLSSDYAVSEELVCWQVINSGSYSALSESEQQWINQKVAR